MRELVEGWEVAQSAAAESGGAEASGEPQRVFRDEAGRRWVAREFVFPVTEWTTADADSSSAGYGIGWLRFSSGEANRRLRLYPKQWHALQDGELERLCSRAQDAR